MQSNPKRAPSRTNTGEKDGPTLRGGGQGGVEISHGRGAQEWEQLGTSWGSDELARNESVGGFGVSPERPLPETSGGRAGTARWTWRTPFVFREFDAEGPSPGGHAPKVSHMGAVMQGKGHFLQAVPF